jgi:hypothetical protein
VHKVILATGS